MRWQKTDLTLWLVVTVSMAVTGCGNVPRPESAVQQPIDISSIPDAVPKAEAKSRYGNPDSYVVFGKRYFPLESGQGFVERGIASWYGKKFHGRRTSSGETYNMYAMTAAHKTLPLPTYVRVTNLSNNRTIVVRVNDRGPFHENRIIDLSYTGATKLGMLKQGTALVEVQVIDPTQPTSTSELKVTSDRVDAQVRLFLQIGAFSYRHNAENLKKQVVEIADEIVLIEKVIRNGKTIYRVRLGPLLNVAHADRLAFLLADAGFEHPHIVLE